MDAHETLSVTTTRVHLESFASTAPASGALSQSTAHNQTVVLQIRWASTLSYGCSRKTSYGSKPCTTPLATSSLRSTRTCSAFLGTGKRWGWGKSDEDPLDFLVDVKNKDGVRPGEPGHDPHMLNIPPRAWTSFTPFEKQVSLPDSGLWDRELTAVVLGDQAGPF